MYRFLSLLQMDHTSNQYMGFSNGASRWSPNLASAAWVIYSPSHELIHIDEICMGIATNNQAEYDGVNGLLAVTLQLGIHHLDVFLDSQLLVSQLNNYYRVRDPCLFRKFPRTKQMVRAFESITFTHVPRNLNSIANHMANDILNWHIHHSIYEAYKQLHHASYPSTTPYAGSRTIPQRTTYFFYKLSLDLHSHHM